MVIFFFQTDNEKCVFFMYYIFIEIDNRYQYNDSI